MNGDEEVKVSGPGGVAATIKGANILLPFILALTLALVIFLEHRELANNRELAKQLIGEMRAEHLRLIGELRAEHVRMLSGIERCQGSVKP